jgi:hypothetical protein
VDPAPVTEGAKGPREYEFARLRLVQKLHHEPGHEGWLMARRPVGAEPDAEVKCYLSNAPETVALPELAWVGYLRWTIEEDFELAKGEVGLDHYEVTKYRGWYHHMTLRLLALAFLKSAQFEWGKNGVLASVPEVRRLLEVVLPRRHWDPAAVIAWYQGQERRKAAATASHRKRWPREHP